MKQKNQNGFEWKELLGILLLPVFIGGMVKRSLGFIEEENTENDKLLPKRITTRNPFHLRRRQKKLENMRS